MNDLYLLSDTSVFTPELVVMGTLKAMGHLSPFRSSNYCLLGDNEIMMLYFGSIIYLIVWSNYEILTNISLMDVICKQKYQDYET